MKKFTLILVTLAVAFATFAALDFQGARTVPALEPQTISAGATNEAVVAVRGLRGAGEVIVSATGAPNRSALDVTLWATNRNEGGWTVYAAQTFAATNAGVYRVAFPGEYLPADVKIGIGSIGAATTATAFILTY